jgi:hypothetical protein
MMTIARIITLGLTVPSSMLFYADEVIWYGRTLPSLVSRKLISSAHRPKVI